MSIQVHDRWIGDHRMTVAADDGEVRFVYIGDAALSLEEFHELAQFVQDAENGYFDVEENDESE